jgi:two-component system chemotaxis response regulator CheB
MVPATLNRRGPVEAVVIGGSAGSVAALGHILPGLPARFPPVMVVVHVPPSAPSLWVALFAPRCAMRVCEPDAFEPIERGSIYFAPADYHLLVEADRRCALSVEPPLHFSRPAIDVLFESAADVYRAGLVGVILTGASRDGAEGLRAVDAAGGLALIEDPVTAEVGTMPRAAMDAVPGARVLSIAGVLAGLISLSWQS